MPRLPSARAAATVLCPYRPRRTAAARPSGRAAACAAERSGSAHPEELGVLVPDLALIQGGAGVAGSNVGVVTGVDTHVPGPPDQIAGLSRRLGDQLARGGLGTRGARNVDPHLVVDVLGEARAVESGGGVAGPLVRRAHVLAGDIEDLVTGPAGTARRRLPGRFGRAAGTGTAGIGARSRGVRDRQVLAREDQPAGADVIGRENGRDARVMTCGDLSDGVAGLDGVRRAFG